MKRFIFVTLALALCAPGAEAEPQVSRQWIAIEDGRVEIQSREVTAGEFKACVAEKACQLEQAGASCNVGRDDRDDHPANCVNYFGAEAYCAFVGGRLCTEKEWLAACRGPSDRDYPYGEVYDPTACNSAAHQTGTKLDTQAVGGRPRCEGGYDGLFDMAGNVAEWIDACKGDYCKFRGAGYLSNEPVEQFAACKAVCAGNQKTLQSGVIGFRCCRSVE